MTNITTYPLEDGFETTLAQERDGATGTIYVNSVPNFTFPSGITTYVIVNPGKSNMQLAEVSSYDGSAKTFTVSNVTLEKGASSSYSQASHSVGSVVRISDNYEFWKAIATAVNSKVDGDTQGFPVYADATARDAAITSPTNGMVIYNTALGVLQQYIAGAWQDVDAGGTFTNASTTAAGKVELATSAESIAGTDTGGTGASLSVLPSDIAANDQSGAFRYAGASAAGTDTYAVTMTPTLTAYTTGMSLIFKADVANTGACTLDVDSLGATSIKMIDGDDPVDGEIAANQLVHVIYDGTNFVVQNPPALATDAEAEAGTDVRKYITPKQGGVSVSTTTLGDTSDGAILLAKADTTNTVSSSTYTKSKEIAVDRGGTYIVYFEIAELASGTAYGKIYVNGSSVGTERTTGGSSFTGYFEEITGINAGDLIQLYGRRSTGGAFCQLRYFRIFYVPSHSYITATVNLD